MSSSPSSSSSTIEPIVQLGDEITLDYLSITHNNVTIIDIKKSNKLKSNSYFKYLLDFTNSNVKQSSTWTRLAHLNFAITKHNSLLIPKKELNKKKRKESDTNCSELLIVKKTNIVLSSVCDDVSEIQQQQPVDEYPYPVDPDDHCETPMEA